MDPGCYRAGRGEAEIGTGTGQDGLRAPAVRTAVRRHAFPRPRCRDRRARFPVRCSTIRRACRRRFPHRRRGGAEQSTWRCPPDRTGNGPNRQRNRHGVPGSRPHPRRRRPPQASVGRARPPPVPDPRSVGTSRSRTPQAMGERLPDPWWPPHSGVAVSTDPLRRGNGTRPEIGEAAATEAAHPAEYRPHSGRKDRTFEVPARRPAGRRPKSTDQTGSLPLGRIPYGLPVEMGGGKPGVRISRAPRPFLDRPSSRSRRVRKRVRVEGRDPAAMCRSGAEGSSRPLNGRSSLTRSRFARLTPALLILGGTR